MNDDLSKLIFEIGRRKPVMVSIRRRIFGFTFCESENPCCAYSSTWRRTSKEIRPKSAPSPTWRECRVCCPWSALCYGVVNMVSAVVSDTSTSTESAAYCPRDFRWQLQSSNFWRFNSEPSRRPVLVHLPTLVVRQHAISCRYRDKFVPQSAQRKKCASKNALD